MRRASAPVTAGPVFGTIVGPDQRGNKSHGAIRSNIIHLIMLEGSEPVSPTTSMAAELASPRWCPRSGTGIHVIKRPRGATRSKTGLRATATALRLRKQAVVGI